MSKARKREKIQNRVLLGILPRPNSNSRGDGVVLVEKVTYLVYSTSSTGKPKPVAVREEIVETRLSRTDRDLLPEEWLAIDVVVGLKSAVSVLEKAIERRRGGRKI